jgi:hypothetical protein
MTLDFSPWVALILGILIGWLFGWFLDLFFDRRRHAEDERRRAELAELQRLRSLEPANPPAVVVLRSDIPPATSAIEEEPLPPLHEEYLEEDLAPPAEVEAAEEADAGKD